MLYSFYEIPNADFFVRVNVYKCNNCDKEFDERANYYFVGENDYHLCVDCAFKLGKINEEKYLNGVGVHLNSAHAGVNPEGNIEIWTRSKRPPWERKEKSR